MEGMIYTYEVDFESMREREKLTRDGGRRNKEIVVEERKWEKARTKKRGKH